MFRMNGALFAPRQLHRLRAPTYGVLIGYIDVTMHRRHHGGHTSRAHGCKGVTMRISLHQLKRC
jgi:hypothetical protein